MTIVCVGIDLAKNVFALHGVDEAGKPALVRPTVPRAKLMEAIAALPPCLVAMEACSGAHHWAREFQKLGHTVRLIAPKFVIPYRLSGKRGKNDAADAAAICEAAQRPSMRFVPAKSLEQQGQLCLHRVRQGFIEERTATINRLRGVLSEFGQVSIGDDRRVRAGAFAIDPACDPPSDRNRSGSLSMTRLRLSANSRCASGCGVRARPPPGRARRLSFSMPRRMPSNVSLSSTASGSAAGRDTVAEAR